MEQFGLLEVLRWLNVVPGLFDEQRASVRAIMEAEAVEGDELASMHPKGLRRMLRGSPSEGCVDLLLKGRDSYLEAIAAAKAAERKRARCGFLQAERVCRRLSHIVRRCTTAII